MRVVAFVITLVPYHHARWQAFSALSGNETHLVEIAGKDAFGVLEYASEEASYQRHILFPEKEHADLAPGSIAVAVNHILERICPDVVCINGYWAVDSWTALRWCGKRRVPVIVFSESNEYDLLRTPWRESVKRILLRQVSAGLVGGTGHREYLTKLGLHKDGIFLGYDAVDNDHFNKSVEKSPSPFFLACSRFTEKKNLGRLIEAFASYRKSGGTWRLVLVGGGPLKSQLEEKIKRLGLDEAVSLPGPISYERLPEYYGTASVFVHASTVEQWGLVVNEAMAAGLPVLVSQRCGCAGDLVKDGENGYVFDPLDACKLGELMSTVAENEANLRKMGERSRRIIENWDVSRFASGLAQAIEYAMRHGAKSTSLPGKLLLSALSFRGA